MENNEDLKSKLNALLSKKNDLETAMNNLESQKVQYMVEEAKLNEEIAKLEGQMSEKENNNDYIKYSNMLIEYNKKLDKYNQDVAKLYELQNRYEQGQIQYDEYEKFALPLAKQYSLLQKDYETLNKLYESLNKSNSLLENLTDEQLNEKLSNLNNEINEEWNYGAHNLSGSESVDNSNLNKLISERDAIKVEKDKRKSNALRSITDEQLDLKIEALNEEYIDEWNYSAHQENGMESNDSSKLDAIKQQIDALNAEKAKRKSNPLMSLTDEQLDLKLEALNQEYIDEWNYGAHQENGMESNDSSRLDAIKQQIDTLNAEKAKRSEKVNNINENIVRPVAPEIAMFIQEMQKKTNEDEGKDNPQPSASPNPINLLNNPPIDEDNDTKIHLTEKDVEETKKKQYEQVVPNEPSIKSEKKWYQRIGASIKGWFSSFKSRHRIEALPSGLKEDNENSHNTDYDDSANHSNDEKQKNSFVEELQNFTQNQSSNNSRSNAKARTRDDRDDR